jgi:2-polyprenyl-3-methyl-5-hydroxy-6-metoxy-1,4-benzoquinol methylase
LLHESEIFKIPGFLSVPQKGLCRFCDDLPIPYPHSHNGCEQRSPKRRDGWETQMTIHSFTKRQFLPFQTYLELFQGSTNYFSQLSQLQLTQRGEKIMTTLPMTTVETDALTVRTKATWMAGDFGKIAMSYAPGAAEFVARLKLRGGERVLDVACGTGNLAIPAARTGARVTGIDIAPNLLEQAEEWARIEGVTIGFEEGNAEQMPYAGGSFDTVMTMFGAMFAPRAQETAAELVRVCRPGGRIVMANWTPDGFIGQMFKIVGKHVPPAPGVPSPLLWGNEATVAERLGSQIADLRCTPRTITFNFPFNPAATVESFRSYYGPTLRAFDSLSLEAQQMLRSDLEELWERHNRGQGGTTQVDSTYLEVIAIRQ